MIVYLNGTLHLWQKSHNKNYKEIAKCASSALGKDYEEDKVHSHIAVLIGMILHDRSTGNLKKIQMRRRLKSLYNQLQLKKCNQNDNLIALSLETIRKAWSCNLPQLKTLHKNYMSQTDSLLKTYKNQAASLQLHGLNEIILSWLKEYRVNLLSTRAIVVGCKRPRKGMIEMQLFEDLYTQVGVDYAEKTNHLIYEEASHELMQSIKIESLIKDIGVHYYCKKIRSAMGEDYPVDEWDILKDEWAKLCPYLSKSALVKYSLFNNNQKTEIKSLELLKQTNSC